jgi:mercuric ion binding protein
MLKTLLTLSSLIGAITFSSPALAEFKIVTLDVPGMNCITCPMTVKTALTKVNGVQKASADFDKREAVVTFDDSKTSIDRLTRATTEAGYPSTVKTVK